MTKCYYCSKANPGRVIIDRVILRQEKTKEVESKEHSEYCDTCGTLLYGFIKDI